MGAHEECCSNFWSCTAYQSHQNITSDAFKKSQQPKIVHYQNSQVVPSQKSILEVVILIPFHVKLCFIEHPFLIWFSVSRQLFTFESRMFV